MKKLNFNSIFRSIVILAMSLLFFKNTNAQNSVTIGTPTSLINGFTIATSVKVTKGDSVVLNYYYAPDTSFAGEALLHKHVLTKDTLLRDTFTVKKNLLPPTDSTGYLLWLRAERIFIKSKDTAFIKPYQGVTVYPKPSIIKVYNLKITETSYGGVLSFFGRAGSPYEPVNIKYSYRYIINNVIDTIVRFPNSKTGQFTGNTGFSQTLKGIFSNRTIKFRIYMETTVDTFDTYITFTTTPTSTKPVVAEGSGKSATADSAFIVVDVTGFGEVTKVYAINPANKDTLTQSMISIKTETLTFRFGKLNPVTNYNIVVYATSPKGIGNKITISIATQPKLVTPTFTALTPEVRWYDGQYSIIPKLDWITNSGEKIKRIDVRIYHNDSLKMNAPTVHKISDANAGLTGPLNGPRIDSDSGRFHYEFSIETDKSIYTSNLLGYTVGWAQVPKSTLKVQIVKQIPIGEKDWMITNTLGQLVSEHYTKDLSVRLSDQNLPKGVIYASTIIDGKLLQFNLFNYGGGNE